jgi:predicted nucleic acid-binding protein
LPLTTSSAVLIELFHVLGDNARDVEIAWTFIRSGAVTVVPISDRDLPDIEALMRTYRDRPMDFADATLVHLAQRESISTIFTIDHDDFETYRVGGRKRLSHSPVPVTDAVFSSSCRDAKAAARFPGRDPRDPRRWRHRRAPPSRLDLSPNGGSSYRQTRPLALPVRPYDRPPTAYTAHSPECP